MFKGTKQLNSSSVQLNELVLSGLCTNGLAQADVTKCLGMISEASLLILKKRTQNMTALVFGSMPPALSLAQIVSDGGLVSLECKKNAVRLKSQLLDSA